MTYELEIAEAAHDEITRNAVWRAEHHSYDQAIRWRDAILFTIREQTIYVLAIHRAAQDSIHPDDLPAVPGDLL